MDGNTGVEEIVIPGSVKTMGCNYISRWPTADEKHGVLWRSSVQRVVIEEGVKRVGDGFACNVSSLEFLELPSSIEEIGQSAFYGTSIHSVVLDHSIEKIESDAFGKCPEDLIIFGYKGTVAEEYAMSNGIQFVARDIDVVPPDFVLPSSLEAIEEEVFMGCAFHAVMIQDGVQWISPRAFADCRNLEQIYIPVSVSEIDADSFSDCSDSLLIICEKDSIAEQFAAEGGYRYQYP